MVIRLGLGPRVPHRAGQVQLFERGQLSDRLHVGRVDVRAHQVEHFDAEIALGKFGDIPDAAGVPFEHDESAHVQCPNGDLAIGVGGDQRSGGKRGQERGGKPGSADIRLHVRRLYQTARERQQFGLARGFWRHVEGEPIDNTHRGEWLSNRTSETAKAAAGFT